MKRLKDKANRLIANRRHLVFAHVGDVGLFDQNAPAAGLIQTGEQAEQRGLATAAVAHNRHKFAALDCDGNMIEHADLIFIDLVGFGYVSCL